MTDANQGRDLATERRKELEAHEKYLNKLKEALKILESHPRTWEYLDSHMFLTEMISLTEEAIQLVSKK